LTRTKIQRCRQGQMTIKQLFSIQGYRESNWRRVYRQRRDPQVVVAASRVQIHITFLAGAASTFQGCPIISVDKIVLF
jgi:hypothetical protein